MLPRETNPNSLKKYINDLSNSFLNSSEADAIKAIDNFLNHFDITTLANELSFTFKAQDNQTSTGNGLLCACIAGKTNLAIKLIDCGMNVNSVTSSPYAKHTNLSVLNIAAGKDNKELVKYLLSKGADILQLCGLGVSALMEAKSAAVCEMLLNKARELNCMDKFISCRESRGINALENNCISGNYEVVAYLMDNDDVMKYVNVPSLLHYTRSASLDYPKLHQKFNALSERLRKSRLRPAPVTFTLSASPGMGPVSVIGCHRLLFGDTFVSDSISGTKESVIRLALSKSCALLEDPSSCMKYLREINDDFSDYLQHKRISLPASNNNTYEFKLINGIYYPIPHLDYKYPKKHSALQEFLTLIFRRHGFGSEAFQWIGFVPELQADDMVRKGYFLKESSYGTTLFHGGKSHMLQIAILLYAIKDGLISLNYTIDGKYNKVTMLELLEQLVTVKSGQSTPKPWLEMLDQRFLSTISFTDPYQFSAVVMRDGEKLGVPVLAISLRDSFCKGFLKFYRVCKNNIDDIVSIDDFVDKLDDLLLHKLVMPSFLVEHAVRKYPMLFDRGAHHAVAGKFYDPDMTFTPKRLFR